METTYNQITTPEHEEITKMQQQSDTYELRCKQFQHDQAWVAVARIDAQRVLLDNSTSTQIACYAVESELSDEELVREYLDDLLPSLIENADDLKLARYQWGLDDPGEGAHDKPGNVRILREGYMYGYSPMSWVTEANARGNEEIIEFDTVAEAQEWIDSQTDGAYYLSNGEAGAPTYYIINA